ncbi:hypothetical protein [Edaphobacter dinghuensis]|uniref:Uncharacterized protein n=1 Tax=Edaphobacter dinghuensis TaxID=1560005 RepID=A0A917HPL4_9BACT|nr:hypothetical protein [Edaphobacter dinghuensis]GGG86651.1 hypothetical protein GCM10011585_33270 [Edaphobacter dinghuensis]
MGYEIGAPVEPRSARLQEAFRQTPEWKAYDAAHLAWREAHFAYFHAPASEKQDAHARLNRAQSYAQQLLAICRAMPKHINAFGW